MITCIHCRQSHEEEHHECLKEMTMEEVMDLPEEVVTHLFRREYRARFLAALFDGIPGHHERSLEKLTRPELVDAIALAREKLIRDLSKTPGLEASLTEFDRMASGLVERVFPE